MEKSASSPYTMFVIHNLVCVSHVRMWITHYRTVRTCRKLLFSDEPTHTKWVTHTTITLKIPTSRFYQTTTPTTITAAAVTKNNVCLCCRITWNVQCAHTVEGVKRDIEDEKSSHSTTTTQMLHARWDKTCRKRSRLLLVKFYFQSVRKTSIDGIKFFGIWAKKWCIY